MKQSVWFIDSDKEVGRTVQKLAKASDKPYEIVLFNAVPQTGPKGKDAPIVVFIDLSLAEGDGENGVSFAEEFGKNAKTKNIPVVIMAPEVHIEEKAKSVGGGAYIKRPFTIYEFFNAVEEKLQ